jgi:hypothetical protein
MNYYQKYLKYKKKYLFLKKYGGKYEGKGSFGIVVSNPRIPLMDETFESIKDLNQVSKILYDTSYDNTKFIPGEKEDFDREFITIKELQTTYPKVFTPDNFILPLKGGMINIREFFLHSVTYNNSWLDNNSSAIKMIIDILKINRNPTYQIIYDKGENLSVLINNHSNMDFLNLMLRPIIAIVNANNYNLFFEDIKFNNMIYHDNKIKIIDYSDFLNLNHSTTIDKFEQVKKNKFLDASFYLVNNPLITTLLCVYIGTCPTINIKPDFIYQRKNTNANNNNTYLTNGFYNYLSLKKNNDSHNSYRKLILNDFTKLINKYIGPFTKIYVKLKVYTVNKIQPNIFQKPNTESDLTNYNIIEQTMDFNFIDIWSTLRNVYELNSNHCDNVEIIFTTYKYYLDKTLDIDNILIELLKSNNMHSVGYVFIHYLINCIDNSCTLDQYVVENIIKVMIMCFGRVIMKNDQVYITKHSLKDIEIFISDLFV